MGSTSEVATIRGVARAQTLARAVIHEVAEGVRPGDRELDVVRRIEDRLSGLGVRSWLHTAYAWWGERTRFAGFADWEPDALPTSRRLAEGEPWIIDVAPIVDGYPADYAFSSASAPMLALLGTLRETIAREARIAADGAALFGAVDRAITASGHEAIHPLYPGGVLGHVLLRLPRLLRSAPRLGDGFQLPIVGAYGYLLIRHALGRGDYPFVNASARGPVRGLFAVEPHIGQGNVGAKFESILLIDGDETRWLDDGVFGEVAA